MYILYSMVAQQPHTKNNYVVMNNYYSCSVTTYMYIHTHTHIHTYIHAYIHSTLHTYIHTCT